MSYKRWTVFAAIAVSAFVGPCAMAQKTAAEKSQNQEMTTKDNDKIGLPTPENIRVKIADGKAVVSWEKSPIQRIVAYQVFRKRDQGQFVPVKVVTAPPFIDNSVQTDTTAYAVAAIDYRGNRSDLSAPGKVIQGQK